MKTCETCAHWKKPTEHSGFERPVGFAYEPDFKLTQSREPGWEYLDDDDYHDIVVGRQFGTCRKVVMSEGLRRGVDPIPLATVTDGSNYVANLNTRAGFGCVLHETADEREAAGRDE